MALSGHASPSTLLDESNLGSVMIPLIFGADTSVLREESLA
jgi:hypothetical protein